jgi:hypothetical protein
VGNYWSGLSTYSTSAKMVKYHHSKFLDVLEHPPYLQNWKKPAMLKNKLNAYFTFNKPHLFHKSVVCKNISKMKSLCCHFIKKLKLNSMI